MMGLTFIWNAYNFLCWFLLSHSLVFINGMCTNSCLWYSHDSGMCGVRERERDRQIDRQTDRMSEILIQRNFKIGFFNGFPPIVHAYYTTRIIAFLIFCFFFTGLKFLHLLNTWEIWYPLVKFYAKTAWKPLYKKGINIIILGPLENFHFKYYYFIIIVDFLFATKLLEVLFHILNT